MLDIIGIGSLNLDLTATAEKISSLPIGRVSDAVRIMENCAGCAADLSDIKKVLSLLERESFRASLGGSAFNTIHAIAELKSGINSGFAGVSGSTGCSLDFKAMMKELAIDDSYTAGLPGESSGVCISVNQDGRRSLLIHPGCNSLMADHLLRNYEEIVTYITKARILHITSFVDERTPGILADVIEEAKRRNPEIKISLDPGLTWMKNITPAVARMIKSADIIFLNAVEYRLLAGVGADDSDMASACRIYNGYALEDMILVAKMKSEIKVYCRVKGEIVERCFENQVVRDSQISDATGAGDVFEAGFLVVLLLKGMDFAEAAGLGSRFTHAKLTVPHDEIYPELARIYRGKF
jgi:sugar/nucleoside kinase (ribokinase family)